ncbi:MAG: WS/DGAT domain-containing protein [Candidatus Nanopelagicales bacterium]|nr:WS/DGAT domain-containing protein [Candidatus Nanopelagicales bacterium]
MTNSTPATPTTPPDAAAAVEQPAVMELSPNDTLWLNMDTPENLMVIESIMWFHHRLDPERVIAQVQERMLDKYPIFRWKPRFSEAVGGRDEWIEDPDFDLRAHITVHELGGAGGRAELQAFLEERFSEPIPHDAPLWRGYILEGQDFGALMVRYHHAIADGTALARILIEMTDEEPDGTATYPEVPDDRVHPADTPPVPEEIAGGRGGRRKRDRAMAAVTQAATLPMAAGVKATSGAAKLLEMLDLDREGSMVAKLADQTVGVADTVDKLVVGQAPDVAVFGRTGVAKRADWAPAHDLATVKRAARARGATVNDLMLAAVAGGIRRYLEARGEPLKDVMTMIPVNLRPVDEPLPPHLGNRFALVALMLPVEVDGAVERLDVAHERMELIKAGPEVLLTFGLQSALGLVGTVTSRVSRMTQEYFADKAIGVTTNVPGPQQPRYFAGQQLVGILGWVPGASNQAIGVCIFSYNNEIRVGFKTDTNVVPDITNLVAAYSAEMEQLLALDPQGAG